DRDPRDTPAAGDIRAGGRSRARAGRARHADSQRRHAPQDLAEEPIMTILRNALVACTLAVASTSLAKTLRWSTQGDASTVDPHAQNESFTNAINGLVYEYLVDYDKDVKLAPALAT